MVLAFSLYVALSSSDHFSSSYNLAAVRKSEDQQMFIFVQRLDSYTYGYIHYQVLLGQYVFLANIPAIIINLMYMALGHPGGEGRR